MTIKNGRNGKKFFRAQQDPQFDWAAGTGASAGFRPEQGVRFSQTKLSTKPGLKLSRAGAQPTRGANTMIRQQPEARAAGGCPPGHLKDHKTGKCIPISCPDGDPFCVRQGGSQEPQSRSGGRRGRVTTRKSSRKASRSKRKRRARSLKMR